MTGLLRTAAGFLLDQRREPAATSTALPNSTMTDHLLHSRKPFPDESLMGFITDLTENNGYEESVWLLEKAGVKYRNLYLSCSFLFNNREWMENLSALTRNDSLAISQISYFMMNDEIVHPLNQKMAAFNGHPIYKFLLRPESPRICASCLKEAAYCRRIWEMILVTTCPRHQCLLIDACPACKQKISWPHRWTTACRYSSGRWGKECGFNWAQASIKVVEKEETRLSSEIWALLGLDSGTPVNIPAPLNKLKLLDFVAVILFFASRFDQRIPHQGATGRSFNALSLSTHHQLFTPARELFYEWPTGFHKHLDSQYLPQSLRSEDSPLKQNRKVRNLQLPRFRRQFNSPQFKFLRDALANYYAQSN